MVEGFGGHEVPPVRPEQGGEKTDISALFRYNPAVEGRGTS
ncbi:MAG: hypothetical protein ACRDI3_08685 [Actinomycetota bacterium]